LIVLLISTTLVLTDARMGSRAIAQSYPTQTIFFAYWSAADGYSSSIVLNNASNIQLIVRPTLYGLTGGSLQVNPLVLSPRQQIVASINQWVGNSGFTQGNLILSYDAPEPSYLGAQVTVSNSTYNLSFDVPAAMPASFVSTRLEGLSWRVDNNLAYDFVLSNTTDQAVDVVATFTGALVPSITPVISPERSWINYSLQPHQTQVDYLSFLPELFTPGIGYVSGISITHTGSPGAVLAYGMAAKSVAGFSSSFSFVDPLNAKSSTLVGEHVLIGSPDIPGFSTGTSFTPVALMRNTSATAIVVTPTLSFTSNGSAHTVALAPHPLAPQQLDIVDIGGQLNQQGISGPFVGAGLTLSYVGAPGSLVAHLTSYDQTLSQVFDVPLKDPQAKKMAGGNYPWHIDGDNRAVLHLKNIDPTSETVARSAVVVIYYQGGSYSLPLQRVEAGQTIEVDIKKLRDEQIKDSFGNLIPLTVSTGQLVWYGRGPLGQFTGRLEQYNVSAGTSSSFSCPTPCQCDPTYDHGEINPSSIEGAPGDVFFISLIEVDRDCNGGLYEFEVSDPSAFVSATDPSIASVTGPTSDPFGNAVWQVTLGDQGGTATLNASWDAVHNFATCAGPSFGGDCSEFTCDFSSTTGSASASVAVGPRIDSMSPAFGAPATTVQVAISGAGFGADSFALADGNGISILITDKSATQLTASFDISLNAIAGDHNVTVRSNNQTSNSKTFSVRVPDHLVVLADQQGYTTQTPTGTCATQYYIRQVQFQVVSSDATGHLPVGNVVVEERFDSVTTNTCGSGQPQASSCAATINTGTFIDTISTGCGSANGPVNCGYDIAWKWYWCGNGTQGIQTLASLTAQVRRDSVTLTGP
jgi:hypothetical protein